jgi:MFS family permease
MDPGAAAFGVLGGEASSELNWLQMITSRVQQRAVGSSRYPWWVLWSLLAGLLALNFTFTVFIVDLPNVAHEFHTQPTVLTWTMIGPLLAYGLAAPILGKVGDIIGHRRMYLFGLAGAMVSAVLTALAPNVILLLGARTLDGIQGAATGTASAALVNLVFRPDERVKAMGWWSLVGAGGPVLGVSIGSPIIAAFGWRALFWFQLILIAVAFAVVTVVLPRDRGTPAELAARKVKARNDFRTMDWIGSWSLSAGVTSLMLGLSLGNSWGWTSLAVNLCWLVMLIAAFVFVYRVRHAANPLIPAKYFRRRNFVMPIGIRAAANFAYFGAFFMFPLLMEQGYGYSIPRVGAVAIARPITFALCSPIAGYVAIRIGERISVLAGALSLTLSLALFSLLQPSTSVWIVVVALALSGFGMGVNGPASGAIMANEVDSTEFGVMSAASMLAMQVGEVAGIQILETVQQSLVRSRHLENAHAGAELLGTFRLPFFIGACVGAVGVLMSFFVSSVPREKAKRS